MRFGPLNLSSNLFLSPLAGYTNLPFRLVVREIGGVGLCTTDLVNARSLIEKNPKAFKLIETSPADSPLAVQLFGSVPEEMRDAALIVEACGAVSVDINMGCPVKKVVKIGGGSAMMTTETAPRASTMRAASRISSGTLPKSCTASGESAGVVSMSLKALGFFSMSERALTRSVVQSPTPPISRTTRRKGRLV